MKELEFKRDEMERNILDLSGIIAEKEFILDKDSKKLNPFKIVAFAVFLPPKLLEFVERKRKLEKEIED